MPCLPDEKCCFNCDKWFNVKKNYLVKLSKNYQIPSFLNPSLCENCNQYKCPHCDKCFCGVSKKVRVAVRAMEKTYERYLNDFN